MVMPCGVDTIPGTDQEDMNLGSKAVTAQSVTIAGLLLCQSAP